MKKLKVNKVGSFKLVIDDIASDKSISHRAAMFSLLSNKPSKIKNFLRAEDTLNTLNIVKALGAKIEDNGNIITITPPKAIQEPNNILDCGNSGTGMRLFCGLLSSSVGSFVLVGDKYLHNRPMSRITKPLNSIGAKIDGVKNANFAPLHIRGDKINGFDYHNPISSAQVKSAMILAALKAKKASTYKENELSRDHTERMLKGMGAKIITKNNLIKINPIAKPLKPLDITIPSDPSSGFFFAVAAAIIKGSRVTIKNTTLNKTRVEAYKILQKMGVDVKFKLKSNIYEPIGDIVVKHKKLHGVIVDKNISWLIDELPALSIAFANAKGISIVKNAKELRVKESDRISSIVDGLKKSGITVKEFEDGYEIIGSKIKNTTINSFGDHRIAMSFAIAGLKSGMLIEDTACIDTSFPNFEDILKRTKTK